MSVRILVTDGMDAGAMELLRNDGYEVTERFYEPEALGPALREFDGVIIRSATKIKSPQINAARGGRLKLIIRAGVGMDNIDIPCAEAAGIAVKNTPRASSNAVAELTVGLMFACARNLSVAGCTMRQGRWEKKAYSKGFELQGKTIGVIGYGRIGRLVGEKCQALGMQVLSAVHRSKPVGCECDTMHFVSMEDLLSQSDLIALCAPAGEQPMITAETIARMKDGAVIINTSRGSNVDETALLAALESGKIRAAGLDVWLDEKAPNQALISHPAVACTPHIGAGTREAQARIGAELVDIVEHFAF